ncbi:Hsp20/alpha crystallin family protein [Trichothermofontia sp.]
MIRTYYRQPYPYARYQPHQRYQLRYDAQVAPRWVDQFVRDVQMPPIAELQPTQPTPEVKTTQWQPPIAVIETPTQFILQIELPGVPAADINLEATQATLRIYGERRRPETAGQGQFPVGNAARSEFRYGPFARTLQFSVAIDPHGITSDRQAGIVTLQIPKLAAQQPETVKVAIAAPAPAITHTKPAPAAGEPVAVAEPPTTVIPLPSPQTPDLGEDPWAASA